MNHAKTLRIDIISDIVCPWCAIGFYRLNAALSQLQDEVSAEIVWHPFELNPKMVPEGENLRTHLANKYGTTLDQSIRARAMLTNLGAEVGFTFNYFDEMRMLNTHDCHRLLFWAQNSGLQTDLAKVMFAEFFGNRGNFSFQSLIKLVEQAGLNVEEAKQILDSSAFSLEIKDQQIKWRNMGIHGVPTMIFNNEKMLTGAQDVEVYAKVLRSFLD